MMKRFLALMVALSMALVGAGLARAHAQLLRSDPAAGVMLASAPLEAVLEFTEALDGPFTKAHLVNADNQTIIEGPGIVDAAQPRTLRLPLTDLPPGSYAVVWRARSAVDGHVTNGSIPFGIGAPAQSGALIPPRVAADPALESPPMLEATARWLVLLTAALALGNLPFALFVWRPTLKKSANPEAHTAESPAMRWLILGGGGAFIIANLFFLIVQAATAAEVAFAQALGQPLLQILSGSIGQWVLIRLGLMSLIMVIAWRTPSVHSLSAVWTMFGLSAGVALTFSLMAHGAALGEGAVLAVVMDWLHVMGTLAWLGGLAPLLSAIFTARRSAAVSLATLVPNFSRLALVSVAILALTGLYSFSRHVGDLQLLNTTSYGRALLAKSVVFTLLFLLGAINFLILSPRLRAAGNGLARAFGHTVRVELALGAGVLALAGIMMSVAPSQTAHTAREPVAVGLTKEASLDGVQITFQVAPAQVGYNELAVDVVDGRPGSEMAPAQVLLRLTHADDATRTLQVETQTTDAVRYIAAGNYFPIVGVWEVEVIVRRPDFRDVRSQFELHFHSSTP
jgi:copper transport protein